MYHTVFYSNTVRKPCKNSNFNADNDKTRISGSLEMNLDTKELMLNQVTKGKQWTKSNWIEKQVNKLTFKLKLYILAQSFFLGLFSLRLNNNQSLFQLINFFFHRPQKYLTVKTRPFWIGPLRFFDRSTFDPKTGRRLALIKVNDWQFLFDIFINSKNL